MAHNEVKEDAEDNIKLIDEAIAQFKSDASLFCPNGHDDLENPQCYCYLTDRSRNEDHSNSETCKHYGPKETFTLNLESMTKWQTMKIKGCLTFDDRFDPECDCQKINKFKDR